MKKEPRLPFSLLALVAVGVDSIPALCVISKRPKAKVRGVLDKLVEYGVVEVKDKSFVDARGRNNYMNSYSINPEYEKCKNWVVQLSDAEFREIYLDIKSRK